VQACKQLLLKHAEAMAQAGVAAKGSYDSGLGEEL
jgi:hypothetical protein